MRIWLDDKREMPKDFDFWAKTADEAAKQIKTGNVTHISFDHDLGTGNNTGYAVAAYIEQLAYDGEIKPLTWEIHTANPAGRKYIELAMESADRFWEDAK
jgi:hypothetical protein